MKKRVYYHHTDAGGVVYHANYLIFCEEARSEEFFKRGIFFEDEFYVVKSIKANYISPIRLGDEVEIKTEILEIKRASILLLQQIFLKDRVVFKMEVLLVYIKNNKISKIPKSHIEIFAAL